MKCKRVQQKLVEYAEESLNEKVRTRIEKHFQHCSDCVHELSEIKKTLHLIHSVSIPEPPEKFWFDFTSKVMCKINSMKPITKTDRFFYFPRVRMAIALLILIGIIGGAYFYYRTEIRRPLHPVEILTTVPDSEDIRLAIPSHSNERDSIEIALNKIVSDNLMKDILESDLALFDEGTSIIFDIDNSDDMIYFLINNLTEEEKRKFLAELYKIK